MHIVKVEMNQKVKSTVEALEEWSSDFNIGQFMAAYGHRALTRHKILTGSRVRDNSGNTLPFHTLS